MPNNEEEKYKKAAVWFSSNKDMRLEAVMRAAGFIDKEANDLSIQRRVWQRPEYMTDKERKASLQISLPQSIKMKNSEGPPPLSPLR